jgi:hypothetical protein
MAVRVIAGVLGMAAENVPVEILVIDAGDKVLMKLGNQQAYFTPGASERFAQQILATVKESRHVA